MCKCGPTDSAPWTNHRTNARREGTGMIIWSGTYRSAATSSWLFGVPATRNREERRADRRYGNRAPSGINLVVKALDRHGNPHLDEANVQQNIWFGLPGALARRYAP